MLQVILMWLRHYDDKEAEAKQGFWNCPCVPMRERYDSHPKSICPTVDLAHSEACLTCETCIWFAIVKI